MSPCERTMMCALPQRAFFKHKRNWESRAQTNFRRSALAPISPVSATKGSSSFPTYTTNTGELNLSVHLES